jgi:hypothetical protein
MIFNVFFFVVVAMASASLLSFTSSPFMVDAYGAYGKPRDVTNFTAEQLLNLRYEYTPEITGMFRECTDKEERKYVSLFLRDRDEEEVVTCSRYFVELRGGCFEGPGRAHVSKERKPMRVYYSEIDEEDGGFAILSEYLGEEEGRMYSRVEYFCDSETAYVREGIDGYKDDEGTFVLPYNAFLMDGDVKLGSSEKQYLHYQSMDTSWYNGNKFD